MRRLGLTDWSGLQRHCGGMGGQAAFRASAHLSRVLVGAGVPPAVHSHETAPSAPVVTADRSVAHGRVNSDRAVDRPCSRRIRPQGPHPPHGGLACLSSQVSRRIVQLVACTQAPPSREVHPEREVTQAGGHTPFLWPKMLMHLLLHLGSGCRPTARKDSRRTRLVLDQRPPCWNGSRSFRKQGQWTRWTPVK